MTSAGVTHAILIAVNMPIGVPVGADFALEVLLSCPGGCDLSGIPITVAGPDGVAQALEWNAGDVDPGGTCKVELKAPLRVGEHVWCVSCAAHESGGWHHAAALERVPVKTQPHEMSLAVWAIPSPVLTRQPFTIKVGAKSTAACDLSGTRISICDESGTVLASDSLGETPWPGTTALYWKEFELVAPAEAGILSWSVVFSAADVRVPHSGASSRFSIATVPPPEHRLTVRVFERETLRPIENAHVRLGAYRAATSGSGIAELMLPKGVYTIDVWKSGYEAPTTPVTVDDDLAVEIAVAAEPEENPDAAWLM
jgi:hypothetical protein